MNAYDLLQPFLVALVTAAVVLLIAGAVGLWKGEPARRLAVWAAPAAGYLAGAWTVRGFPAFPPVEAGGWLYWSAAFLGLAGLALPRGYPAWLIWPGRIVLAGALVFLLLRPLIDRTWEGYAAAAWPAGVAAGWLAAWFLLARGRRSDPDWLNGILLLLAAVGLSVLLMIGGVASYSQNALALAGAVAGAGLGALPAIRRVAPDSRPAVAVVTVLWAGLLTAGSFFADVRPASALLALAALLAVLLPSVPKLKNLDALSLFPVRLLWMALCLGAAIAWTYHRTPRFDF